MKSHAKANDEGAKRFIDAWQTSESVDDVMRKVGIRNRRTVIQKAARYRAKGVELKRMPWGFEVTKALDWEGLSEYASAIEEAQDEREG